MKNKVVLKFLKLCFCEFAKIKKYAYDENAVHPLAANYTKRTVQ